MPSQTGTVVRPSLPITTLSQNTPPPLVASIGSTSVHQTRMSSNISSSTSITPVAGASVTAVVPKAHLLQAANVRPSPPPPLPPVLAPPHGPPIGMPTPVAPKAHLLQVVGVSSNCEEGKQVFPFTFPLTVHNEILDYSRCIHEIFNRRLIFFTF